MNKLFNLAVLLIVVEVLALLALAAVLGKRQDTQREVCVQVQQINGVIHDLIARSIKTLPTIAYYRAHPEELGVQLEQAKKNLALFKPHDC